MNNTAASEAFVTTEEVANFLGKPSSWLYNNAHKLHVPRYRVGTQLRYRLSEVAAWVEQTGRIEQGGRR
ncbi:helix-turn-helix domain-containing protein [Terrabacter sp. NPDC000476]|uniref:helix-turn-helix domain-containing protein n=1 Tax=Terrabacter sp. NPDC000476 TaxID=3154258 RepID=UPI003317286F